MMLEQPLSDIRNMRLLSRKDIERISTQSVRNIYVGQDLTLCKMLTKYKIYLDGRDAGVVPNILMDGFWESWITKFIVKQVSPGSICIDAGANFGYYSLLLAELSGRNGTTLAIEPNAYLCKLLAMTANINEFSFGIINKAASDVAGKTTLSVPEHLWGSGTIMSSTPIFGSGRKESVLTDTLDNIVKSRDLTRVDFIKMDCEGAEPNIFAGMQEILANNPQLKMVMEYSPFLYSEPRQFTEFLFQRFEVGEITGDSTSHTIAENEIERLLGLRDHIDLFLSPKPEPPIITDSEIPA